MVDRVEPNIDRVLWSDEEIFKLNGSFNRHNRVYWASDSPEITTDGHINLPGICVWCVISSKDIIGPFDETVAAKAYLAILEQQLFFSITAAR